MTYDYIIIGGGIVGLACAYEMRKRYPKHSIVVLEQEKEFAAHQTGRNSGVVHAGVYYTPSSLKAQFCTRGNKETYAFCAQHKIKIENTGKLVVATKEQELTQLKNLFDRAKQNGLASQWLDCNAIRKLEPHINALSGILVPESGIVSYLAICQKLAKLLDEGNSHSQTNTKVTAISQTNGLVLVETDRGRYSGKSVLCCPGIYADRFVRMLGDEPDFKMVPFKGEYFQLNNRFNNLFKHLIYPVPDPKMPFLGVHLTKMIDGSITVGPNATLAMARYGYGKWDFNLKELLETLSYPGFLKMMRSHLQYSFSELKSSVFKSVYLNRVQQICPSVQMEDLLPYKAGIRAQAIHRDGSLVDDFLFHRKGGVTVVCNAPSPAATSAFPIARHVADLIEQK